MRQFVNNRHFRLARDNGFHIHFFQHDVAVFNAVLRYSLQIANYRLSVGALVRFDDGNDHIHALLFQQVRFLQHLVSFPNARRRANVNAKARPLAFLQSSQKHFGRNPFVAVAGHRSIISSQG